MELEYKGHKATLEVQDHSRECFFTFAYDGDHDRFIVTFASPLINCKSNLLTGPRDIQLIKALYTKWWEQEIDKL